MADIHLTYELETETKGLVTRKHFKPSDLPQDELDKGIIIDETLIPELINQVGKMPKLYINPIDSALWYEYVDRELTDEELLKVQNETNKTNIAELAKEVLILKSII